MKKIIGAVVVIAVVITIVYLANRTPLVTVTKSGDFEQCAEVFNENIVDSLNSDGITITIAGTEVTEFDYQFIVSPERKLMVEGDFLRSLLSCSVLVYQDGKVLVMKGNNSIMMAIDSDVAIVNEKDSLILGSDVCKDKETGKLLIPIDDIAPYLSYHVNYNLAEGWIDLARDYEEKLLPAAYDMRRYGRIPAVRDQGRYGTCWAFASLGAFESTLLPYENLVFSTDHMTLCNSYSVNLSKGGEHTMSIAYLAAWQGPVFEEDDPYGDGKTNPTLKPVKHLEEALVINNRDFDVLKSAIFRYGALETSLYSQMEYADSESKYYSRDNCAYYYDGDEVPNHDVVVVGWDDNYPKEKFTTHPEGDGAFICQNSWGEEFGEDGFFYVSYYDKNICNKSVVYTRVGEVDNYDKIYQSDLLGWVGLMGFGKENAFFSNVYEAGQGEELSAVSFYATDVDTEFEVFVVRDFEDTASFRNREAVVSGSMKYAGYYTVAFPEAIPLKDNEKYAVVVKIKTPGAVHPIAIEYNVDERTDGFDIADGEGYISLYGELWHSAEATQNCNVCLKAFTRYSNGRKPEIVEDGMVSTEGDGTIDVDMDAITEETTEAGEETDATDGDAEKESIHTEEYN